MVTFQMYHTEPPDSIRILLHRPDYILFVPHNIPSFSSARLPGQVVHYFFFHFA